MVESRDLREQILGAAKQLFIEQGYRGLAMRQIAEAVGVSKAALYYHFKDKEELLLAILDGYLNEMEATLVRIQTQELPVRRKIDALLQAILRQPAEQRAVIRLGSQEMAQLSAPARAAFNRAYHEKFIDRVQAMLQAGIDRGELRPIDPSVATWTLLGMMYPYFYPAHSQDVPAPSAVLEQILTIYLDGIGA